MWQTFKNNYIYFSLGFASFPVVYYVVKTMGAQLWQDVKVMAYGLWDKVRK